MPDLPLHQLRTSDGAKLQLEIKRAIDARAAWESNFPSREVMGGLSTKDIEQDAEWQRLNKRVMDAWTAYEKYVDLMFLYPTAREFSDEVKAKMKEAFESTEEVQAYLKKENR